MGRADDKPLVRRILTIRGPRVILKRLAHIDKSLLEHDTALQILWKRLQPLLAPPPGRPKRRIGFQAGGN